MNSKDQYWAKLKRRNRALNDEQSKMTLTVAAFRQQIVKAHAAGFRDGMDTATSLRNLGGSDEDPVGGFKDMIDQIRRGKKK